MKKAVLISIFLIFSIPAFSQVKELQILHWNDLHAHDLPYKVSKKDSTGKDNSYIVGGISNMLGYLNKYRNSNTLVLNGGDDFQGSPISSITRGRSQIELLNLFNLDAFVVGNHEFDYGQYNLDSALMGANFDYLSGNVYMKAEHKTLGKPYIIKEINGIKIGIAGVTALDLETLVVPKNISDVEMLNSDSVIAADITALKDQNCDLIILLTHVGVDNDKKIAEKFYKDVDVIVGGHSHTPLWKPVIQNGVIITQAGSYSRWLGQINLNVDTEKDTVVSYTGKLIETVMDSTIYDKAAEEKVENMVASIQPELLRVIGTLSGDWKRGYSTESNLGQWEADAVRAKLNTDVAFLNSGGIRKDLAKGNITVGDIWEINPFGNTIVTFNVNGKTLRQMIKNSVKNRVLEIQQTGSSDMIVASGVHIEYDSKKVLEGSDDYIVSFKVNGKDVDDNANYTVATNNYVGEQFKKYFGAVDEPVKITDSNIIDRDLLIEAVEQQKNIDPVLEARITDLSNQKLNEN